MGWKEIKGMNERRFISIPIQAINQLGADRDVRVPRIKEEEKRRDEIGIIKEEKFLWWGLKSHALVCHLYISECMMGLDHDFAVKGQCVYYTTRTSRGEILIRRFTAYRLNSATLLLGA